MTPTLLNECLKSFRQKEWERILFRNDDLPYDSDILGELQEWKDVLDALSNDAE